MRRAPIYVAAALLTAALGAPWLAPQDPFDLATVELSDAEIPRSDWATGTFGIRLARTAKVAI